MSSVFSFFVEHKLYKSRFVGKSMGGKFIVIASVLFALIFISGCSVVYDQYFKDDELIVPVEVVEDVEEEPVVEGENFVIEEVVVEDIVFDEGPYVNMSAPDFSLRFITGEPVTRTSLLTDGSIGLYFFTSYCRFCQEEMSIMKKIQPQYKNRVRFIGIDVDEVEDVDFLLKFKKQRLHTIDFSPYNIDLMIAYDTPRAGTKIAIDEDGVVQLRHDYEYVQNDWRDFFESIV
jgi:thiol-disulfide isomerase/thioredoxin